MQSSPAKADLTDASVKTEPAPAPQIPSQDKETARGARLTEKERTYSEALAEVRRNFTATKDRKVRR